MSVLHTLPEDVRAALLDFRLQQGLDWKERLLLAWYNGRYPAGCESGLLQGLRNHPTWGPWAYQVLNDEAPLTDEMAAEFGFKSPLKLKVTKFYPVDVDRKVIYDAPEARERDVAARWPSGVIGLPGKRLNAESVYRKDFTLEADVQSPRPASRPSRNPSM